MSGRSARVLLVERSGHSTHPVRLAVRGLGAEFELTWASRLATALELAGRTPPHVIVLDPAPPDTPGIEAVRRLRAAAPDAPLLLLVSADDVGLCSPAMEEGAYDYLFKEALTIHLLARTIRSAVERQPTLPPVGAHLIDPLTGLANREGLFAQAAYLWRVPARLHKGATLLCLSLDDATTGSARGERALAETADVLRETFRGSDLRARLGGNTFAVLAVGAPEPTAPILTVRLDESLSASNARDGRDYYLTLRVGLSFYDPRQPCTFPEMLRAAETRLGTQTLGRRPVPAAGARVAPSV
jgi:diguanylate cyclase (GGDEF)-like protein